MDLNILQPMIRAIEGLGPRLTLSGSRFRMYFYGTVPMDVMEALKGRIIRNLDRAGVDDLTVEIVDESKKDEEEVLKLP